MAKTVINSFNSGELSPYLYARSDFDKYRSGCLTMENFVPLPYGGATRRPAIEYLGDSKEEKFYSLKGDGIDDYINIGTYELATVDITVEFKGDGLTTQTVLGSVNSPDSLTIQVTPTEIWVSINGFLAIPYDPSEFVKIRITGGGNVYKDDVFYSNITPTHSFTSTQPIGLLSRYSATTGPTFYQQFSVVEVKNVEVNSNLITANQAGYFEDDTTQYFNMELPSNSDPLISQYSDSTYDKIRLIPFTASVSASYVLELGDQYVRFWKDGELISVLTVPVEIGSPWSDTELNDVKFAQSVDVMWLVHPNHAPQRISRFSDTSWTIGDEQFDYPPLMEENETDITMSPSATTGTITLTSSQDFFDVGHVGSYMKFDSIRLNDNTRVKGSETQTFISEPLYVSGSDWSLTTDGTYNGKVDIDRSLDGSTWEPYIAVGDSTGVTAVKYTISSEEPEPFNARIRVRFVEGVASTFEYNLIADSIYWESMVKIIGYNSATEVTAEVIADFQDVANNYTTWAVSTAYTAGVSKVTIDSGISYVSGSNVDMEAIDVGLGEIVGSDFDGTYWWIVTTGVSNKKLWKLDSAMTAVESGFPIDLSGTFATTVYNVFHYAGYLYISGNNTTNSIIAKFDTSGVFQSYTLTKTVGGYYLGTDYGNNNFYIHDQPAPSSIKKYSTSWVYTGKTVLSPADDITYHDGMVYSCDTSGGSVSSHDEDLNAVSSTSVSGQTASPTAIGWDGSNIWVFGNDGSSIMTAYKYDLESIKSYYECVVTHNNASSFQTNYEAGYWREVDPVMTTWSEGAFSDYRGQPSCIALFESRLCYAGTVTVPDTIWTSQIDDYSNFRTGTLDTDALKLTLNSGKLDEIRWLVPQERLVIGTAGSEWSLGASDERKPITPTGFDLKRKTTYGSNTVQAILVNSAVLFLMRQGRKVREWTPNYNAQDYVAADLSILAEHITEGGVQLWEYQQQPDNILWSIRADGTLLGFTYERDQNVTGWHRHSNDEFSFESIAIIPRDSEEDEVYVSVNMNGTRIVGRLNDREWGTNYATQWQGSDLYVDYQSAGDASHLIGKTVDIVIDGVVKAQEVVDGSGNISATLGTNNIVGLPFTSTLAPVYLNSENKYGTSQGSKTSERKGTVRFKDTFSAKVGQTESNLEDVKFDEDETALYSEDAPVWFDNSSEFLQTCYITQQEPMPCTVLALIASQEVGR